VTNFEDAAKSKQRSGIFAELIYLLRHNKKWWLIPIIVCAVLLAVLVMLAGTGAAPFIYTLF
jgi:Mg2+/citrate symporter